MREPYPESVSGDFYVERHCCTSCGYPLVLAPALIGWADAQRSHCYWMKQPETREELRQAFLIFQGQELGCHRYAGTDPEIQARLAPENCDHPLPSLAVSDPVKCELRLSPPTQGNWLGRLFDSFLKHRSP